MVKKKVMTMDKKTILMGTDTVSGIAPEILDSIIAASKVKTLPYGNDIFRQVLVLELVKFLKKKI